MRLILVVGRLDRVGDDERFRPWRARLVILEVRVTVPHVEQIDELADDFFNKRAGRGG